MQGFSASAFAVAAFSVAAFALDSAPTTVIPEPPRYYSASLDAIAAQRRQQLEEDEAILAIIQQFVMGA